MCDHSDGTLINNVGFIQFSYMTCWRDDELHEHEHEHELNMERRGDHITRLSNEQPVMFEYIIARKEEKKRRKR